MNSELEELYQQVILQHSKRPANFGTLDTPCAEGEHLVHVHGDNPSCGDEIDLSVKFAANGSVSEIKFTGQGCAISQASASMMTIKSKGKSKEEVERLMQSVYELVKSQSEIDLATGDDSLGELQLLQGVSKFPQRVKCATLAWRALEQALQESSSQDNEISRSVSTED